MNISLLLMEDSVVSLCSPNGASLSVLKAGSQIRKWWRSGELFGSATCLLLIEMNVTGLLRVDLACLKTTAPSVLLGVLCTRWRFDYIFSMMCTIGLLIVIT